MCWALAALVLATGYFAYSWPGVVLALTVIAFWMLLQFSRALRVMRNAAQRPVGHVDSVVMLQSKLHKGMRLAQILQISRSFGHQRASEPETYAWRDAGGSELVLELDDGRLMRWRLQRAEEVASDAASDAAPDGA